MDGLDRETALRVEKVRMLLDYSGKEVESHRQHHIIAFAALLGASLTGFGTTVLERLPWEQGLPFTGAMMAGACYYQVRLHSLPRRLWKTYRHGVGIIDMLMKKEED